MESKVYGRLKVIGEPVRGTKRKKLMVPVRCECGNEILADKWRLENGQKKSCGCLQQEKRRNG